VPSSSLSQHLQKTISIIEDCVPYLKPAQKEVFKYIEEQVNTRAKIPSLDQGVGLIVFGGESDCQTKKSRTSKPSSKEYYKERRQVLTKRSKMPKRKGMILNSKRALGIERLPAEA
jgi:hypothetical protein